MLKVFIDGAYEPLTCIAGYGLIIKRDNEVLHSVYKSLGASPDYSNNVAEYAGLLGFFSWYLANGNKEDAEVCSDSQMLIMQMSNKWKAKGGKYYNDYVSACNLTKNCGGKIVYKWIPREQNTEADKLSKLAVSNKK